MMKKGTKRMHEQLLEEDEREIKQLSKRLRLKDKKTPRLFKDMGMDFILDHLEDGYDSETGETWSKKKTKTKMKGSDKSKKNVKAKTAKKQKKVKEPSRVEIEEDSEGDDVDDDAVMENLDSVQNLKSDPFIETESESETPAPPSRDNFSLDEIADVTRRIRRLLNQLDEAQMVHVTRSMSELFQTFPRALVKDAFAKTLSDRICGGGGGNQALSSLLAGAGTVLLSESTLLDAATCLTVVHANTREDIGPFVLEQLMQRFDEMGRSGGEDTDNVRSNVLLVIAFCYKLGMISADLVFDLLLELAERTLSTDLQAASRCLVAVGLLLRKESPTRMKEVLEHMYDALRSEDVVEEQDDIYSKKDLEEIMMGVKNNNPSKLPRYDPRQSDRYRKCLKTWAEGPAAAIDCRVPLRATDLRDGGTRGRWWVVGSAFRPEDGESAGAETALAAIQAAPAPARPEDPRVEAAARRLGMGSGLRRDVFGVLVAAEDADDALVRLLGLCGGAGGGGGSKKAKFIDTEVVAVLWHCLLAERRYNSFYTALLARLCQVQRKYMMQVRFSIYDQIKKLPRMKSRKREHLSKAVGTLLVKECLPLSIFKNFDCTVVGADDFMRQVLTVLLTGFNTDQVRATFSKVSTFPIFQKYLVYILNTQMSDLPVPARPNVKAALSSCTTADNLL